MSCRCRYRKSLLEARHSFEEKRAAYFDYNATTPVYPEVLGVRDRIERNSWYNASSLHSAGLKVWQIAEDAKQQLGKVFGLDPEGFGFAHSASEAFVSVLSKPVFDDVLICTTAVEHSSIYKQARFRSLAGKPVCILPVGRDGTPDPDLLEQQARKNRICLVYSAVNHETGAVQPLGKMYGLVKKHGGTVVLDAVQAAARMVPGEWTGHADMLVFSGHKMYGPKGIAAVWINPAAESFLRNWRRQGFARGTADISAIAGLAKAAELCTSRQKAELPRMRVLMREGLEILEKKCEFTVNSPENSAPGICNISFPRVNNMAKLLFELDARNIQLSRFSACTSGLEHPSRILLAMGKTRGIAEKSVRICLGRNSSRNDFFRLANELSALQKSDI